MMRMHTLIRKFFHAASALPVFLARNLWCGKRIAPFTVARSGAFLVGPLSRKKLAAAMRLYSSLNGGKRLDPQKIAILWLLGSRLGLVARDADKDEVVGLAFYYFNARDRRDGTVHVGYSGLCESARGMGLGTFMRRHALENFALSGLSGVSSRVSVNNLPSLKTNQKLGFAPVETYFDPAMGEMRHYLNCNLSRYRKSINEPKRTFQK